MLVAKLCVWRRGIFCSCLAAGLAIGLLSSACCAADSRDAAKNDSAGVEQLVTDALHAEIDGNVAKRRVLLSMAIDANPDYSPARWQSGQLFTGGEWAPVKAAQAAAAANPAREEYESLRSKADNSPEAQLALARWCRKNGFDEEARFHWRALLTFAPNNDEALRALNVRWFAGRLMTKAEIAVAKEQLRRTNEAIAAFAPQVGKWQRLFDAGDLKSRNQALDEIRSLRDIHAIPALEEITLDRKLTTNEKFERSQRISDAFIEALDAMPDQAATLSLTRHAVFSPLASVREASTAALKLRSPHDYMPTLLGALAMPIESTHRVVTDTDGSVHYFHSLYREGPLADWSFEGRFSAMQHDLQGPTLVTIDDQVRGEVTRERFGAANNPVIRAEMASVAQSNQRQLGARATSAELQIAAANRATEAANALLIPVLTATTGENFGDNPRAWWDWWLRYNEYSSDEERPVQEQRYADSTHRYYRAPSEKTVYVRPTPDPAPKPQGRQFTYGQSGRREVVLPKIPFIQAPADCFAAGTPVWTRTGLQSIESLKIGDFVLAQSVETGELAYKPVLGRTVRPTSPCLKIALGAEPLVAAAGHSFWVAGIGWQMAKELEIGAVLHGVNGPINLDTVAETESVETYNLVVADFNTYFVGESGVMVHDVTPRRPTATVLPGLSEATTQ